MPNVPLSVTVPHTMPIDKQVDLAIKLVEEGVDIIQTEGGTSSTPVSYTHLTLPTICSV